MAVTLAGRLRTQIGECARLGSPLYAELLARAAEDVDAGGVADWLERVLASPPPPGTQLTVVWHSVVWQYLGQQERERTEAALAAAAERARRGRGTPLACLALESRR